MSPVAGTGVVCFAVVVPLPSAPFGIATHEAGHAVVAASLGKAPVIRKVSVVARGRGVGHLAMLAEDRSVLTVGEMQVDIAIAMGGFAAEELAFGQPSTGSEADVERATNTARDMAGRFGLSSRLGPVRVLQTDREVFVARDYLQVRDVSQPTLEHLDAEVRRLVEGQKDRARAILDRNRRNLGELASALIDQETIQGPELSALLRSVAVEDNGTAGDIRP